MEIRKVRLSEYPELKGVVVVIDVIRAFTTAAYAFHHGAEKIFMVADTSDAYEIQQRHPEALLIGESQGVPLPGFHLGNSPTEIAKNCMKGKILVQRTSCGTQGVIRARNATHILTASFVVANATVKRIRALAPKEVTFLITGMKSGDEDAALADYLAEKLLKGKANPHPYLQRVRNSPSGLAFASTKFPQFPHSDLEAACFLDRFPFAMEVFKEDNQLILKPNWLSILPKSIPN